ncbi:MAG: endonuclease/exonuclease/phosphatase family protein [Paludibacter sp.]
MKNKFSIHLAFAFSFIFIFSGIAQNSATKNSTDKVKVKLSCVAFYNLENLFDTINNENVNDEEYTPEGPNKWNSQKYNAKIQHMSYAISQIGLDYSPVGVAFIGVSEIENRGVLEDLIKQPALANRSYEIVHYDSPDRRGVDVGLLYNPKLFIVTNSKSYRLHTANPNFLTRDQLMVSGYLQGEKVHVIVNHWPSRYGGEDVSQPNRIAAAGLTRSIADSLFRVDPKAKIIIMGDLNDDPSNESCAKVLGAKKELSDVKEGDLYNTLWKTLDNNVGSLAYNDRWNLFDQIIISSELAKGDKNKLHLWKAEVFNKPFLTQQEGKYKGTPWRTHSGGVWTNGYSDHYPTLIYLVKEVE